MTVAEATATAATNCGNEGSGTMAEASERPCLQVGRWHMGNGGDRNEAAAAVSAATVECSNGSGEVG